MTSRNAAGRMIEFRRHDTTVIRLLDGPRASRHAVIDNFLATHLGIKASSLRVSDAPATTRPLRDYAPARAPDTGPAMASAVSWTSCPAGDETTNTTCRAAWNDATWNPSVTRSSVGRRTAAAPCAAAVVLGNEQRHWVRDPREQRGLDGWHDGARARGRTARRRRPAARPKSGRSSHILLDDLVAATVTAGGSRAAVPY